MMSIRRSSLSLLAGLLFVVMTRPAVAQTAPVLSLPPTPVVGGQTASGLVILAQPNGPSPAILTLTSSNPSAAVVPATITIPANFLTIDVPITTFAVSSPDTTTIGVSYAGGSASATLAVVPPSNPPAP